MAVHKSTIKTLFRIMENSCCQFSSNSKVAGGFSKISSLVNKSIYCYNFSFLKMQKSVDIYNANTTTLTSYNNWMHEMPQVNWYHFVASSAGSHKMLFDSFQMFRK